MMWVSIGRAVVGVGMERRWVILPDGKRSKQSGFIRKIERTNFLPKGNEGDVA